MTGQKSIPGRGNCLHRGLEAGRSGENLSHSSSASGQSTHRVREDMLPDEATPQSALQASDFTPRGVKRPESEGLLAQMWGDGRGDFFSVWLELETGTAPPKDTCGLPR